MRCPACRQEVLAQRTSAGERMTSYAGPRFVVSAPCPCCSSRLFAWTEGERDVPEVLFTSEHFLRWREASRGWGIVSATDVATIALLTSGCAMLVVFAAWAVYRAFVITSQAAGRALLSTGPSLILAGLTYIACIAARDPIARRRAERRKAYREPPGGLRVVPEPPSYRG